MIIRFIVYLAKQNTEDEEARVMTHEKCVLALTELCG